MHKNSVFHVLLGVSLALGLVFLLVFGLAALIWSGTLPPSMPTMILNILMGLCAFIGGRFAIGKGSGEPMLFGIFTGGILTALIAVICLAFSGTVPFHGGFLATILFILSGGAFAGLLGNSRKGKKKKKR